MIARIDLNVSSEEIARVFAPGIQRVVEGVDPEWAAREARLIRKSQGIASTPPWWRRMLAPARKLSSREIYETKWTRKAALARFTKRLDNIDPVIWRDQRLFAFSIWITRVHLLFVTRLIETLKPRTVLELGSGMGLNLFLLADRFPAVRFSGIELTSAGHRIAQQFRDMPTLPAQIAEFSPTPLVDHGAHRQVELVQGTAAQLPFHEDSFDLIYTTMALEQMDAIRDQVFREAARVCSGHIAMFEQFSDFNQTPMRKALVAQRGFFSAGIADLSRFGLTPVYETSDMPSKLSMGVGLVVAATRPQQA